MSELIIQERPDSREFSYDGDSTSGSFRFWARGYTSPGDVTAAVLLECPPDYDGAVRQRVAIEWAGADFANIEVSYGKYQPNSYGAWSYNFRTTGGTAHVTQSLETVASYAPAGMTPTDHGGAIGVNGDDVQGCDIVVPKFAFSISYQWDPAFISPAYALLCKALTGKLNYGYFWHHPSGHVLFTGAEGSIEGDSTGTGPLKMTYNFEGEEDLAGEDVGGMTISKPAWTYLWFEYLKEKKGSGRLGNKAIGAFVERLYRYADFSLLGIPIDG